MDCLNNKPKDADGLPLKKKRIPGTVPLLPEVCFQICIIVHLTSLEVKPELPINLVGSPSLLEQVKFVRTSVNSSSTFILSFDTG